MYDFSPYVLRELSIAISFISFRQFLLQSHLESRQETFKQLKVIAQCPSLTELLLFISGDFTLSVKTSTHGTLSSYQKTL